MTPNRLLTFMLSCIFMLHITLCYTQEYPEKWSLEDCINYALSHNIQLRQSQLTKSQLAAEYESARASLLPTVSASTNQNVSWRPFSEQTVSLSNGTFTSTSNELSYNGSYGINANWTVWNGGINRQNIKKVQLSGEIADLDSRVTSNTIQEQIVQYYVQIIYLSEAVNVNKSILESSKIQRDRAAEMVDIGSLAKADLAQMEAQVSQDEYNVVNSEVQLSSTKLQLKQLLQLVQLQDFDIVIPEIDDSQVLSPLPPLSTVYSSALTFRPEIESAHLNIESSKLEYDIAKRGYYPTISLMAGIGTGNNSVSDDAIFKQLKNNMNNTLGLSISVPIFDGKQNRTNIIRAQLAQENSQLELENAEQELYSKIETSWLNAKNSQQQYIYAKSNLKSNEASYELLDAQFNVGLKNIAELLTGKNNLIQAKQQVLQSKYTALLNLALIRFYQGNRMYL